MDIYNYLLRKNGYETEDYAYLLFYYPDKVRPNGEIVFHSELVKMKTHPEKGEEVFKEAVKCLEGDEPKAGKRCEWCGWMGLK
jgi:hypothetical protein